MSNVTLQATLEERTADTRVDHFGQFSLQKLPRCTVPGCPARKEKTNLIQRNNRPKYEAEQYLCGRVLYNQQKILTNKSILALNASMPSTRTEWLSTIAITRLEQQQQQQQQRKEKPQNKNGIESPLMSRLPMDRILDWERLNKATKNNNRIKKNKGKKTSVCRWDGPMRWMRWMRWMWTQVGSWDAQSGSHLANRLLLPGRNL